MPNLPPPPQPPRPGFAFLGFGGDDQRVGDAERDQVAAQLAEHHVAGRLDSEELSRRTESALAARTAGELRRLTGDLPQLPSAASPQGLLLRPRGPFPGTSYAGFWARAGGLWLDLLALGGVMGGVAPVADASHLSALLGAVPAVYFVGFWGAVGRSPGMWVAGVRLVREEDGGRLGFRRSLLRAVGYLLDLPTLGVGCAWAAVDRRRQAWHDKMAGSYVIRSR